MQRESWSVRLSREKRVRFARLWTSASASTVSTSCPIAAGCGGKSEAQPAYRPAGIRTKAQQKTHPSMCRRGRPPGRRLEGHPAAAHDLLAQALNQVDGSCLTSKFNSDGLL
jgi:hypothetical protein